MNEKSREIPGSFVLERLNLAQVRPLQPRHEGVAQPLALGGGLAPNLLALSVPAQIAVEVLTVWQLAAGRRAR